MKAAVSISRNKLFLIDSLGALLTAVLLFFVVRRHEAHFGMPEIPISILSLIAIIFSVYSFCCFLFVKNSWKLFLKIIIKGNIMYCCTTMALVLYNLNHITGLGMAYFSIEVVIIGGLVYFEIKAIHSINKIY
ncbi:MAG: hypothetical protein ACK40G_09700 [Cytophagaceae bacterium]